MKILNQGTEGGKTFFAVKTKKLIEEVQQEFQEMYPQNHIVVEQPDNLFIVDMYIVTLKV